MQKTIHFCDRCGKKIKPTKLFRKDGKLIDVALEYEFQKWKYGSKSWELCHDCAKALFIFMNNPDHPIVTSITEEVK